MLSYFLRPIELYLLLLFLQLFVFLQKLLILLHSKLVAFTYAGFEFGLFLPDLLGHAQDLLLGFTQLVCLLPEFHLHASLLLLEVGIAFRKPADRSKCVDKVALELHLHPSQPYVTVRLFFPS